MIKFLLNQEVQEETNLAPDLTVLEYLRTRAGKTGTKEGCASGDCGACTVVLGSVENGQMTYKTANSCLTFVGSLHGKQLITVEDLQNGEQLHPAQQAMVDCHGSQCGFCTPGFVMSLFAMGKNVEAKDASHHRVDECLSGNLCRCTGYRPIRDAAQKMYEYPQEDQFTNAADDTVAKLQALQSEGVPSLDNNGKLFFAPQNLQQLAELLDEHKDAHLLGGGTDLSLMVTQFWKHLDKVIYVGAVKELLEYSETDSEFVLGAAVSLTDVKNITAQEYPDFEAMLERFAATQVRNTGTLGGNIANASPIGDAPPVLIALNAQVTLTKKDGERTVPLTDYFLDYKKTILEPGEFISKIILPKKAADQNVRIYKVSKRLDDDISAVLAAFNITVKDGVITDARLGFGGMAAIPKLADNAQAALIGQAWNEETIEKACEALANDFTPLSDMRATKEYRALVAQNLLRKSFVEISENSSVRVTDHA